MLVEVTVDPDHVKLDDFGFYLEQSEQPWPGEGRGST